MVDMDEVMCEFTNPMAALMAARFPNKTFTTEPKQYHLPNEWNVTMDEFNEVFSKGIEDGTLFTPAHAQPYPLAIDAVQLLRAIGYRVVFATARLVHNRKLAVQHTVDWLEYHQVPYDSICFGSSKELVDADIYFEDNPETIARLKALGKNVAGIKRSYNNGPFDSLHSAVLAIAD